MKMQTEDLMDVSKVIFTSCDFLRLFDQSSGHAEKHEDGLTAKNANHEHSKRVPNTCQTILDTSCISVHNPLGLQAGAMQELVFLTSESCEPKDWPICLSLDKQMQ